MFSEYAEKFELAECQLAIVHCAGHHDPMLVQKLWRELLNQELTSGAHLPMVSMMNNLRSKIEVYISYHDPEIVVRTESIGLTDCGTKISLIPCLDTVSFSYFSDVGKDISKLRKVLPPAIPCPAARGYCL